MKHMKKVLAGCTAAALFLALTACGAPSKERVVIFSSSEEYRNDYILSRLQQQFPHYDITLQYLSTGNHAAKLSAEGTQTECDIVLELECSYMEQLKDLFAPLEDYDFSHYLPELVPTHKRYAPWYRISGAVIVNTEVLAQHGAPAPTSYAALLNPMYAGLISMSNPKLSSTGYMFLKQRVNALGETAALAYFDALSENITQLASSGSGPVNALLQKEAAIGLGITYQAVNAIAGGAPLEILLFEDGAPYSTGGMAMIDGRQGRPAVREVFDYLYHTIIYEDKEKFAPEAIFTDKQYTLAHYPAHIRYADMTGIEDIAEKERLLQQWTH